MSDKFNFIEVRLALEKELKELPKDIAEIIKDDGVKNIKSGSYNGKNYKPRVKDEGHPILNKSGKLLDAVNNSVKTGNKSSNDSYMIKVINDYGLWHQEGTDKIPKRQIIGETNNLDKKVIEYIHKSLDKLFEIK